MADTIIHTRFSFGAKQGKVKINDIKQMLRLTIMGGYNMIFSFSQSENQDFRK